MRQYRITVYLNRIKTPYLSYFDKAREYNLRHGVDIIFIFIESDVSGYKSIYDKKFERYILNGANDLIKIDKSDDATIFVFDQSEWATGPGSKFPLRIDTPTGSSIVENRSKPFITIGTYIIEKENGQTFIEIIHEIMHSYVQNSVLEGIFIPDVMDTYRENNNPDSPTGNFSEQWKLLAPYLTKQQKSKEVAKSVKLPYNRDMAKRDTTLGIKPKSRHSRKTKKRLAIKKVMLATKAAKKRK